MPDFTIILKSGIGHLTSVIEEPAGARLRESQHIRILDAHPQSFRAPHPPLAFGLTCSHPQRAVLIGSGA